MKKNQLISLLLGVLVLQILLAAGLHWASSRDAAAPEGKLLELDFSQVDAVYIADETSNVELRKVNQAWQVPAVEFPASETQVQGFFDKLSGLQKGWPVARSAEAAERFKVDDTAFERKITLSHDGQPLATLYLGTSPSYRYVHLRRDDQDEIYSVELSVHDAAVSPDDWIDKEILQQSPDNLKAVSLNDIQLVKTDGGWRLADLSGDEQTKTNEVEQWLSSFAAISIDKTLGKTGQDSYNLDKPEYVITLELNDGKQVVYRIGKPQEASYFVVKSSALEHFLQVPGYILNPIVEKTRAALVEPKSTEPEQQAPATE